jgi:ABC-type multidrug transport system fused ATPase/permease subunit
MKIGKETGRKPKYGMLSCVAYMYRIMWKYKRSLVFVGILKIPAATAASVLTLCIPSVLLGSLERYHKFSPIAFIILGLVFADTLLALADSCLGKKAEMAEFHVIARLQYQHQKSLLERDFYLDYDPMVRTMDERARRSIESNHARAVHFPMDFSDMISVVLRFFLFGACLSLLDPLIVVLLIMGCVVNIPLSVWERRRSYETQDKRNRIRKKLDYLSFQLARDFRFGKEIRLYHLGPFLSALSNRLFGEYRREREKVEQRSLAVAAFGFFVVLVRDGAAYAFLIGKALSGEMDAAGFVLYFSAISQMAGFLSDLIWKWSGISEGALQVSDYREDLEVCASLKKENGIPVPSGPFSIEFKDVSYRYPNGERNVLKKISFRIGAREKVALVGVNGAGKTTLTKLMCGLLVPTEGEILLDGHALQEYNRDEVYELFGLIPQNYHLLPVSIARNIACTDDEDGIDREKLARCITLSGLLGKLESLPMGAQTPLNRQVNPDGTELSGGEIQKLLLARLLYRSPGCMILDEPTAALDPIAEDRMYRMYRKMAERSTAVFISHRLVSTRFCDRIFLLDAGGLAETGTHRELMAAGKKYRKLFEVQSKYYKDRPGERIWMEEQG